MAVLNDPLKYGLPLPEPAPCIERSHRTCMERPPRSQFKYITWDSSTGLHRLMARFVNTLKTPPPLVLAQSDGALDRSPPDAHMHDEKVPFVDLELTDLVIPSTYFSDYDAALAKQKCASPLPVLATGKERTIPVG